MPEFEIKSVPQRHIAAIRMSASMDKIGEAMGEGFGKAFHAVTDAGIAPAGPPLARYLTIGTPVIEFECAIPVATPFAGDGEVQPGTVGGGEAAVGLHVGPYDAIGATWEALMAWIKAQGRDPAGPGWESYIDDPQETEPAKLRTEVYLPVG